MVFIFSASVPLISIFGFLYFLFKYYIDKYNFVFVYETEFESGGIFANQVITYSTFGLFLFQLVMFGLFASIFGSEFIVLNIILLVFEVISMVSLRMFDSADLKELFQEIEQEMGEDFHTQDSDGLQRKSILTSSKSYRAKANSLSESRTLK
mmetsp:Transcript_20637/g.19626  ORF Transcript_20637/g.19626 Transcript_20637/m.19626 type:complete len:152 (+) Transcript_20637:1173-1628(+)